MTRSFLLPFGPTKESLGFEQLIPLLLVGWPWAKEPPTISSCLRPLVLRWKFFCIAVNGDSTRRGLANPATARAAKLNALLVLRYSFLSRQHPC